MRIYDFEYDGVALSDFGYTICSFDSSGIRTVSGVDLNINTSPILNGQKHEFISANYDGCIQSTFQICRNVCLEQSFAIPINEYRNLTSWLSRKGFKKFKPIDTNGEYLDIYFEATFNINKIEYSGSIYGLELNMVTNRPYALQEPVTINIENTTINGTYLIHNQSDEDGYIYPEMEIIVKQDGNLTISNSLDNRFLYIANCKTGEKITLNHPIITSSFSSHKIANDFNWNFFRLISNYHNRENELTISIPCTIIIKYSPVAKITF